MLYKFLGRLLSLACTLVLPSYQVLAQIPAASLFQTPLQIHPGLAGNTGKHRIAFLANRNDYYVPATKEPAPYLEMNKLMSYRTVFDNAANLYASYDQLWNGYGIGGFATYSSLPQQTNTKSEERTSYGYYSANGYSVGIVVSPKLRIPHPINPNEAKYTISPSLMLSYKGGAEKSIMDIPERNYFSLRRTFMEKSYNMRQVNLQVGVVANTSRGYVGYNMGLVYDLSEETGNIQRDTLLVDLKKTFPYLAMQHSVCLGLVFPKRENSAFTFSPITSLGVSHSIWGSKKDESVVHSHIQTGFNWFGYLHQSLNFRYKWVLFGGSYTEYLNQRIGGYHVGAKFRSIRCTLFYSFWDKNTAKTEASVQFQF